MITSDDCGDWFKERCFNEELGIYGGPCPFEEINNCPVHNDTKTEEDLLNAIREDFRKAMFGVFSRAKGYQGRKRMWRLK